MACGDSTDLTHSTFIIQDPGFEDRTMKGYTGRNSYVEPSSPGASTEKSSKSTTKETHPPKRQSSFIRKLREKYPQLFRSKRGIRPKEGDSKSAYGFEKVHFAKAENVVRLSPNFQEPAQIKDSNKADSMSNCVASASVGGQVGHLPSAIHASGIASGRMSLKERVQANRQSLQGLLNDPKVPSVREKLNSNRQSLKDLLDKSPFRKKLIVDDFVKSDTTDKNTRSRSLHDSQTKSSSRTLSNTRIAGKSNISTSLLNSSSEVNKSCSRNQLSNNETVDSENFTVENTGNKPSDSDVGRGTMNSEIISPKCNVDKFMQNNRSSALFTSVIEKNNLKVKSSDIGNVLDEDTMISFMQSSPPKPGYVDKTKGTLFKSNEDSGSKIAKLKSHFNNPSEAENIDRSMDQNSSGEDVEGLVMKSQTAPSFASASKDTPNGDRSSSYTSDGTEDDDEQDDAAMEDVECGSSSDVSISDTDTTPEGVMQDSSSPVLSLSSLDDGEPESRKFMSVLDDGNHKSERHPFAFSQKLERKRKTSIVDNVETPEIDAVNVSSGECEKSDMETVLVCQNEKPLFCEKANQDSQGFAEILDETSIQVRQSVAAEIGYDVTATNAMAITAVEMVRHRQEGGIYGKGSNILEMKDNYELDEATDGVIEKYAGINVGDYVKDEGLVTDVTVEFNGPTSTVIPDPDPHSNSLDDVKCEDRVSFNNNDDLIGRSKEGFPDEESNIWEISDKDFIQYNKDVVIEHETNSEPLITDKLASVNRIDADLNDHVCGTERNYETEAVESTFEVLQHSQTCELSQRPRSADEIRASFPESFGEEQMTFEHTKAMLPPPFPDSSDVSPAESEQIKRLSACDSMVSEKSPFGDEVDWWNHSDNVKVKDDAIEVEQEDPIGEWSNYLDASISGECHSDAAEDLFTYHSDFSVGDVITENSTVKQNKLDKDEETLPDLTTSTTGDLSVDAPVHYVHVGDSAVSDVTSPSSSVDFTEDDNDDTDPQLGIPVVIDTEAVSEKYKLRHPRTKLNIRCSQILNSDDMKTAFEKEGTESSSDVVLVSGNIGTSLASNDVVNNNASTPYIGTDEVEDDLQVDFPLAIGILDSHLDSKLEKHDSENDNKPDSKDIDNGIDTDSCISSVSQDIHPTHSDGIETGSRRGLENNLKANVTVETICNVTPKIDVPLSDEPKQPNLDHHEEVPKALMEENIVSCGADKRSNIKDIDEIKIKQELVIDNSENKENIDTSADQTVESDGDHFSFMKRPMIGEYYLNKPKLSSSTVSIDVTSSDASVVDASARVQPQEVVQQVEQKKPEKKKKRGIFARLFKKKKGKYLPADVEYDSEICKRIYHNNMGIPYKEKGASDFMHNSSAEQAKTVTFDEAAKRDGRNATSLKKQISGPSITDEEISTPTGILKSTKATSKQSISGDVISHVIKTQTVSTDIVPGPCNVSSKVMPQGRQNMTIDKIPVVKKKSDTFIHSSEENDINLSKVNAIDLHPASDVGSSIDNAPNITHDTKCSTESQSLEGSFESTVSFTTKNGQQETPMSLVPHTGLNSDLTIKYSANVETLIHPAEYCTESLPDPLDEEISRTSNPGPAFVHAEKCASVRSEVAKINSESLQVRKFPDSVSNPFIVQNTRSSSSSEGSDNPSATAQKNVSSNDMSTASGLSDVYDGNMSHSISTSSSENPCVVQIPTDKIDITDHDLQTDGSKSLSDLSAAKGLNETGSSLLGNLKRSAQKKMHSIRKSMSLDRGMDKTGSQNRDANIDALDGTTSKKPKIKQMPSLKNMTFAFKKNNKNGRKPNFDDTRGKKLQPSLVLPECKMSIEDKDDICRESCPTGSLVELKLDGTRVIEIRKPPQGSCGFYIAQGNSQYNHGIFVSRFSDGYPESLFADLLEPGDEILDINGQSPRSLTLEEVHDLMAIQRKLILTVFPLSLRRDV